MNDKVVIINYRTTNVKQDVDKSVATEILDTNPSFAENLILKWPLNTKNAAVIKKVWSEKQSFGWKIAEREIVQVFFGVCPIGIFYTHNNISIKAGLDNKVKYLTVPRCDALF